MVELASAALAQKGFDPAKTPDVSGSPFFGDGGSGTGAVLVPDFMIALAAAGSDEARNARIIETIQAVDDSANEHATNVLGHAKKTVPDMKDGELAFLVSYLKATRGIDADPNETDKLVFKVEYDPPGDRSVRKRSERPVRTGAAHIDRDDAGDRAGRKGRDRQEERLDNRDSRDGKNKDKDNGKGNDSSWQAEEAKKARKAAERLAEEVEAARVKRVAAAKAKAVNDIAETFAAADRAKAEKEAEATKAPTIPPATDDKPKTKEDKMADIPEITEDEFKKNQAADAAEHDGHGGGHGDHGAEGHGDQPPAPWYAATVHLAVMGMLSAFVIATCGGVFVGIWHYCFT